MVQYSALRCVSDIWQNNEKPLISNGLRFIVTCLPTAALWVLFHQSRHSFASVICLSLGVPIETVSRIMGHKNITTTQHYAKVTYDKIDKDVSELDAGIKGKFSLKGIEMPPSTILKDMSRRVCRKTWKMSPEKIQERKERKEREMKMKGEAV